MYNYTLLAAAPNLVPSGTTPLFGNEAFSLIVGMFWGFLLGSLYTYIKAFDDVDDAIDLAICNFGSIVEAELVTRSNRAETEEEKLACKAAISAINAALPKHIVVERAKAAVEHAQVSAERAKNSAGYARNATKHTQEVTEPPVTRSRSRTRLR